VTSIGTASVGPETITALAALLGSLVGALDQDAGTLVDDENNFKDANKLMPT
jgi:hypothetical protein